jgi:DNA-binding MarR family transcriptional regulator
VAETRITFTLNHLVSVLNSQADAILRERYGMTFSQFLFLTTLHGSRMSMTDLARCLGVSTAAVSKRAPWFEERGLIKLQQDRAHERRILLDLTPRGSRLALKAAAELDNTFVEHFQGYDGPDLAALNDQLNQVLAHLTGAPADSA